MAEEAAELRLTFVEVKEQVFSSRENDRAFENMDELVWKLFPMELLEIVLVYLPPSSQARFCVVCKRWSEVMTSPAFQEKALLNACRLGYVIGVLQLKRGRLGRESMAPECTKLIQVRKLDIPQQLRPPSGSLVDDLLSWWLFDVKLLGHAGMVGFAFWEVREDGSALRCCLFDLVKQTWMEVPRLLRKEPNRRWKVWLAGRSSTDFRLFVIWGDRGQAVSTYSSASLDWLTVPTSKFVPDQVPSTRWYDVLISSKGRYVFVDSEGGVCRRVGKSSVILSKPLLPILGYANGIFEPISSPGSEDVFAVCRNLYVSPRSFKLCKLDGGRWEIVVSRLPPGVKLRKYWRFYFEAHVVGGTVLVVISLVADSDSDDDSAFSAHDIHILAYSITNGSCQWLHHRLPQDTFRYLHWGRGQLPVDPAISYPALKTWEKVPQQQGISSRVVSVPWSNAWTRVP